MAPFHLQGGGAETLLAALADLAVFGNGVDDPSKPRIGGACRHAYSRWYLTTRRTRPHSPGCTT